MVGVVQVQLGPVLLGGARDQLERDSRAPEANFEAVFSKGRELKLSRGRDGRNLEGAWLF